MIPAACNRRKVDDNLRRLPEMKNDGVRRIAGSHKLSRRRRKPIGDAGEVALDRHCPLSQDRAVERTHDAGSDPSARS